jgi:PAS domain S-box-containing protein
VVDLSRHVFEVLRSDEDFILYRGRREDDESQVLVLAPAVEYPRPDSLKRLEREFSFGEELDSAWAARPIGLARHWDRTVLLLEDPGGRLLDQLLGNALDLAFCLRVGISLANVVGHLHQRGIIHKDIKPANVLVNSVTGQVWLMGLGIASRLARERQSPEAPEFVAGTLAYMAPEQTGRMNRSIDSRSDLYSLGVTLYQMVTGGLPFTAVDPMEWMHCHIARKAVPPSERLKNIPTPVSAIVMKLLAKTAEERYQTAAGVESDLRRCLAEWESLGRIDPFPVGTHDVSDLLLIPEKLYGRDAERKVLLDAFDRVADSGRTELVLVSGHSGIGKSSIVHELHKVVVLRRGIFISGKFDQQKRDIPYASLAQAFQSLVREILSKSDEEVDLWREAIRAAVGVNGQLVVNLIPELELIIGKQPHVSDLQLEAAQNRFQMVFIRFLGVFARAQHPLALFLDDLQWLDTATLQLLERLVTEPDARHLLLVGAYRDNEVSPSHRLMRTISAIHKTEVIMHEIRLKPLSLTNVTRLVADALRCQLAHARPLAELVQEKTAGNPFFAIQFLTHLSEEHLLKFDARESTWTWDVNRIAGEGFTDNVADLVLSKLKRLPAKTQKALRQLACLGNSAEITTFSTVQGRSEKEIHSDLWEAVRNGLVLRQRASYKFLHDQVQEAAYALIPPELRHRWHLRIGRLLIGKMTTDQVAEKVFDIVNQFNAGLALSTDAHEKEQVAALNLQAGRKAKASTAYASACTYLSAGMELVRSTSWERRYELMFDLWLERAECEYLNGNFNKADGLITELLPRAASKLDKAAACRLRILLQMMRGEYRQAINTGLECLCLFGIRIPPHPNLEQVHVEHERLWQNLGERPIESLVDLPLMADPEMQVVMRMLSELCAPAASASFADNNLFYLLVCHMAIASLNYGLTDASVHAYADLALILGPAFNRYHEGYRFAKLARSLFDKYGPNEAKSYVCMEQVSLWTQPITTAIEFIRLAFRTCINNHDLTYACFCCNHLVTDLLLQGVNLEEVWRESQKGLEFVLKVRLHDTADVIVSQQRFILNMRGETATFSSFSNAQFEEKKFEAQLTDDRMPHLVCYYWILKLQARFISGDFDVAIDAAQKAKPLLWSAEFLIESVNYYFYSALTIAATYETTGSRMQSAGLEVLKQSLELLGEWSRSCPETFLDKYTLVSAEVARIEHRDLDAMRLYEEAIRTARENGFVQDEGIANELAAQFCFQRGLERFAYSYLYNARYCYLRWGALGKVKQLDERYPAIEQRNTLLPIATIETPIERLDLGTVMEVSEAVSGEIVLEQLVQKLMLIAVEHAGAERGLLILPYGEQYRIAAEARTGHDEVEVQLQQASVLSSDLPDSLLRYVMRTQESVILDDASVQTMFSEDVYIRQRRPRSVLCLALVKQAELKGVLYLENNLAPRVFTTKRLALLKLIASQAAISLDHARLYADLVQENNERRKAEEALRASEERWSTLAENSSAGIALIAPDGRYIAANLALQEMLGYTESELQSRTATEITYEEDQAATEAHIAEAQEGRRRVYRFEKRYVRKDGTVMWADISSVFVPATGSNSGFFTVVIVDITKRKRAEEQLHQKEVSLREAQAELAHVSRVTTIGELTASIVHEVNQPLAGIVTNASASLRWLAGDSPDFAETREAIQRIVRDGRRAGEIIGRIRALAKKAPPKKDWLDLNETISEVIAMARSEVQRNRVSLQTELAGDLPLILGDKIQLQQVILNLLMNAIEAMSGLDECPRELAISSEKIAEILSESKEERCEDRPMVDAEWTHVLITVRDSGPGLDPQRVDRLFDAFYTTKPQGLGMGLAISRSIIEAHGGRLWAKANPPRGAVFQFTLPVHATGG